jgi:hypothetical protein
MICMCLHLLEREIVEMMRFFYMGIGPPPKPPMDLRCCVNWGYFSWTCKWLVEGLAKYGISI